MCLTPINMYDTGKINSKTGKRILSSKPPKYALTQKPYLVPCGKCALCLDAKRKEWIKRLQLESLAHSFSSYITLTHDDSHLPWCHWPCKRYIQLFLKRFRNVTRDLNIAIPDFRYFIASERGSKTHRPHYHGILFGVNLLAPEWKPRLIYLKDGKYPIIASDVLSRIWKNGFVTVDVANASTISYVAKYITKAHSWSLHSIQLGVKPYLKLNGRSVSGVSPYGYSVASSGKIGLPSRSGTYESTPPTALLRYLRRFDESFYNQILERFKYLPLPDNGVRAEAVNDKLRREQKQRKYDNEN